MRKLLYILPLLLALSGCGYILYHDPILYSSAPKWHGNEDDFLVFDSWPTNRFEMICRFDAASDVGDYPDNPDRLKLAIKYAKRYGGNAVILGHDAYESINSFNIFYLIYVEK